MGMPTKKPLTDSPETADPANAGKGMPARTPLPQRARAGKQATPADSSAESSMALPHERDQSPDMTGDAVPPEVAQAAHDLKRGIKDTSKGLEMDQAYKKLRD